MNEQEFFERVRKTDSCWVWTGRKNDNGYGIFTLKGKMVFAHRFSFGLANGSIPIGKIICHRCDNPPCVLPDHLYLGTHKDNMADCLRRKRHFRANTTACPSGHLYGVNTYVRKEGHRVCRTCRNEGVAKWRSKNKDHLKTYYQKNKDHLNEYKRMLYQKQKTLTGEPL